MCESFNFGKCGAMDIRESLMLADTFSKISLMTSSSVQKRLVARSLELKFGHLDADSGSFVPPKDFLLYLVRYSSDSNQYCR